MDNVKVTARKRGAEIESQFFFFFGGGVEKLVTLFDKNVICILYYSL